MYSCCMNAGKICWYILCNLGGVINFGNWNPCRKVDIISLKDRCKSKGWNRYLLSAQGKQSLPPRHPLCKASLDWDLSSCHWNTNLRPHIATCCLLLHFKATWVGWRCECHRADYVKVPTPSTRIMWNWPCFINGIWFPRYQS